MSIWTKFKYFLQGKRKEDFDFKVKVKKKRQYYRYENQILKVKLRVGIARTKIYMRDGNVYDGPSLKGNLKTKIFRFDRELHSNVFAFLAVTAQEKVSGIKEQDLTAFVHMLTNSDGLGVYMDLEYYSSPPQPSSNILLVNNNALGVRKEDIKEVKLLIDENYEEDIKVGVQKEVVKEGEEEVYE